MDQTDHIISFSEVERFHIPRAYNGVRLTVFARVSGAFLQTAYLAPHQRLTCGLSQRDVGYAELVQGR